GLAPEDGMPSAAARALGTRAGSDNEASPTNQAPSLYEPRTALATATATVVLPIPPGPTIVRNRHRASCAANPTMTSWRPTIRVRSAGRLPSAVAPFGAMVAGGGCSRVTGATKA